MADKRMFSKQIIDSDAFLDMPASTQSLYFHLGMRGDDEGFINSPKKIQRMIGSSDDDIRILISKNFVIPFDSGVLVIKHWRIHNTLRADRVKDTVYQDEKKKLTLKNNGVYTMTDKCLTSDGQMSGQCSVVEVSLDETSVVESSKAQTSLLDSFEIFWKTYPKKTGKDKALAAWKKKRPNIDDCLTAMHWQIPSEQWQKGFIPNPATYINEGRWQDEPQQKGAAF